MLLCCCGVLAAETNSQKVKFGVAWDALRFILRQTSQIRGVSWDRSSSILPYYIFHSFMIYIFYNYYHLYKCDHYHFYVLSCSFFVYSYSYDSIIFLRFIIIVCFIMLASARDTRRRRLRLSE